MKRYWLLVLAILSLQQASRSQTIVHVFVYNAETREPISHASVKLISQDQEYFTDANGRIAIRDLHRGSYTFSILKEGYEDVRRSIMLASDSLALEFALNVKTFRSSIIEVSALRAVERFSPVTFSEIKSEELRSSYFVQDVPEVLSNLPSTMFYSENGNGIGYNYLRIRGFDQRRLAVMINGIPQNDPEDNNVYWLDFSDLLASTENIQVQRGAGSAFYGPPAIGGSINIITGDFTDQTGIKLSSGFGSYNTQRYAVSFGSGVIDNAYSFFARLSKITSDGYRDKSWTKFNSYYLTASRYGKDMTTRLNFYGGPISDGLAYQGLPKFAIQNEELRRANYNYWEANQSGYTYTQARRSQEIEEFSQPHYELLHEWRLSDYLSLNNTLFYVVGQGFFDYDGTGYTDTTYYRMTSRYGFSNVPNPIDPLIRAYVDNRQFGWLPRLTLKHDDGTFTTGLELRRHRSLHWGKIQWAENLPETLNPDRHYYEYRGGKDIVSVYVQEMYQLSPRLNVMGNVQYAFNRYRLYDEKFVETDFTVDYHFINPRLGVNYNIDETWNVYTNISYTSREPRLKNLYDAAESSGGAVPQFEITPASQYDFSKPLVKPEALLNVELGVGFQVAGASILMNAYLMNFKNEIVKSGQLDRFGQPITGNAKRTQHSGIEMSGRLPIIPDFQLEVNGMISSNKLKDYTVYQKQKGVVIPKSLNGNHIAGFPDYLSNVKVIYKTGGLTTEAILKIVGPQYTDNFQNETNKVDLYVVVNGYIGYRIPALFGSRSIELKLAGNNLFNRLYAMSGESDQYFVAAERNVFFNLSIEL